MLNDLIFSLLLGLLIVFAWVFRANYHLFTKMLRDVFYIRDRLSLFEYMGGNETVFRSFMIFQSLFLCSVAFFITSRSYGYIEDYPDISSNLSAIGLIFIAFWLFYLFKLFMYRLLGAIFLDAEPYRMWKIGYTASAGTWGVMLYIPVLWLAFIGTHPRIPIFTFITLYLLWRLIIIYKTIRIFNIKGIEFLYIILYLCGQEFLPLIFLYEGIKYLYNFY